MSKYYLQKELNIPRADRKKESQRNAYIKLLIQKNDMSYKVFISYAHGKSFYGARLALL